MTNNDTLEALVAEAAREASSALQEERFTDEDREAIAATLPERARGDVIGSLNLDRDLSWKDAFCIIWPFIKKWLEKLKEKVKPWIRWLIAAVIRLGDGICRE